MNGSEIQRVRKKLDMSEKELAQLLGLADHTSVIDLELGRVAPTRPTIVILKHLSDLPTKEAKNLASALMQTGR